MASMTTRKNGSRFITFRCIAGQPRHITLGRVNKRYALAVKIKVEDLVSANIHGHTPTDETVIWLKTIEDRLYEKLEAVGLIPERQRTTLGQWLDEYLAEREDDLKPSSLNKLRQVKTKLLAFFDYDTPIRSITPADAADWRRFLKELGLSEATIKSHSGNAKTIMAQAVRRKVLDESPFTELKSGPTPSRYTRYITPDEIARVIDACPNAKWRLLFGLSRYAGLRIPSESHILTWADVDFDRGQLTVRSPKTEHHAGHEQRIVPITPKLMPLLQDRFDTYQPGEDYLVTIGGKGALIRPVRQIWKRAGVEPWKRLWQTQRQSCEKEWAMFFPQYAVSKWIGHSITISGRHYANDVPDELLDKASDYDAGTTGLCGSTQSSAQRIAQ